MEMKGYSVAKLNGSNYFMWQIKVRMILQKEKLWHVIHNEEPNPITEQWTTNDQSAMATIGLTLEDNILISIGNCRTAKEAWMCLKGKYKHSGLTSKLFLLKKLYSIKFSSFNCMEDYLNGILEITERLRAIGENVKENHIVAIMLCGLPETYNPIITALEARDDGELKLNYVAEKLRDEATRQESQESIPDQLAMKMNQLKIKSKIVCHLCGMEGHIKRNCPKNTNTESYNRKYGGESSHFSSGRDNAKEDAAYWTNHNFNETDTGTTNQLDLNHEWALTGKSNDLLSINKTWIVDSGATSHMTSNMELFTVSKEVDKKLTIVTANGQEMEALSTGEIDLEVCINNKVEKMTLNNVLYVPGLKQNLISVIALCREGYDLTFNNTKCEITKGKRVMGQGLLQDKIYILQTVSSRTERSMICIHAWHERLGHKSLKGIKDMSANHIVDELIISKCSHNDFCEPCKLGSMTQKTFNSSKTINIKPFSLIVSDVCGPITPMSIGGNSYFLTLTDDSTNYTQVYLMKRKSDVTQLVIGYLKQGYNKFKYMPEVLRSDGGGEYLGNDLKFFLHNNGITHQTSVPRTPQQNGKSERKNRTLLEMARSMMKSTTLPLSLWGEAINTACYILNRVTHSSLRCTPYEKWFGQKPNVKHLRIFGRKAYAFVDKTMRDKMGNTSRMGYLTGYGTNTKCYRIWIPGSKTIINSISASVNELDKYEYPNGFDNQTTIVEATISDNNNEVENEVKTENGLDVPRRSFRTNKGIAPVKWTY